MTAGVTETAEGARTVEALRLGRPARSAQGDADVAGAYAAERYTLFLRTVLVPDRRDGVRRCRSSSRCSAAGCCTCTGRVTLGQVTAVTLYVQQLIDPVDSLISWLDEVQVGSTSLARLLGVAQVPSGPRADRRDAAPDEHLVARDVRFAYRGAATCCTASPWTCAPGERLAMVGPSGAGKSTLGRLLAGIHAPRDGHASPLGGVRARPSCDLDDLRGHVALVTQEHHVFVGTLRDNVRLARPDGRRGGRCGPRWPPSTRWTGSTRCPDGLDTQVGPGGAGR